MLVLIQQTGIEINKKTMKDDMATEVNSSSSNKYKFYETCPFANWWMQTQGADKDTLFDTWSNNARMSHGNDLDPRSLTIEYIWGIPKKALCNLAKLWYAEFRSYHQQVEGKWKVMTKETYDNINRYQMHSFWKHRSRW